MVFGTFIKERRIALGKSLRAFCELQGYDPGNHSKLERGILSPPEDDRLLQRLAAALQIKQGSSEWFEFCDLASVARRQIPKPLMEDAEVVAKLPVLFRTLQGEPLPPAKMDELIDFIRSRQ